MSIFCVADFRILSSARNSQHFTNPSLVLCPLRYLTDRQNIHCASYTLPSLRLRLCGLEELATGEGSGVLDLFFFNIESSPFFIVNRLRHRRWYFIDGISPHGVSSARSKTGAHFRICAASKIVFQDSRVCGDVRHLDHFHCSWEGMRYCQDVVSLQAKVDSLPLFWCVGSLLTDPAKTETMYIVSDVSTNLQD